MKKGKDSENGLDEETSMNDQDATGTSEENAEEEHSSDQENTENTEEENNADPTTGDSEEEVPEDNEDAVKNGKTKKKSKEKKSPKKQSKKRASGKKNGVDTKDEDEGDEEGSPKRKTARKRTSKKNVDEEENGDEDYEVEKIVDRKKIGSKIHYLIRWKGYKAADDTWEAEDGLNCADLIKAYESSAKNNTPRSSKQKSTKRDSSTSKSPKGKKRGSVSPAKKSKRAKQDDKGKDNDNEEYEVEKIVDVHYKKKGGKEYLVKWRGYPVSDATWEPEKNLNCPDIIEKFNEKLDQAKDANVRDMRENPSHTQRFAQATGRRQSRRNQGSKRHV